MQVIRSSWQRSKSRLEVARADKTAGRFYEKLGFTDRDPDPEPADRPTTTLTLDL